MLLRSLGAVLLTIGAVDAFRNSSPFVLLSTQPLESAIQSVEVAMEQSITRAVTEIAATCSASTYVIISQPGLTTADLRDTSTLQTFKDWSTSPDHLGRAEIANVIGIVDTREVVQSIAAKCGTSGAITNRSHGADITVYTSADKQVIFGAYTALPNERKARTAALKELDAGIASILPVLKYDYVVILASTPIDSSVEHAHMYEMDEPYPTAMHQDLKRGLQFERRISDKNSSSDHMQDGLPLFEKYKFLSPGIFMGLTVSLLLVVILWVGVSAIAGLEVSYAAFSKEMGPAAQNKGKQQ